MWYYKISYTLQIVISLFFIASAPSKLSSHIDMHLVHQAPIIGLHLQPGLHFLPRERVKRAYCIVVNPIHKVPRSCIYSTDSHLLRSEDSSDNPRALHHSICIRWICWWYICRTGCSLGYRLLQDKRLEALHNWNSTNSFKEFKRMTNARLPFMMVLYAD